MESVINNNCVIAWKTGQYNTYYAFVYEYNNTRSRVKCLKWQLQYWISGKYICVQWKYSVLGLTLPKWNGRPPTFETVSLKRHCTFYEITWILRVEFYLKTNREWHCIIIYDIIIFVFVHNSWEYHNKNHNKYIYFLVVLY